MIFFKQISSKIDYAKGYLDISGITIPFFSPETITASPRTESLFYVRIENPEIKIGYIPKIKIAHGIYLGDTIVENVSGKAFLNVISTLDEEVEVQVPILRLKPLNELFDNYEGYQLETADMQTKFIYPKNNQENCEVYYSNADNNINDKEDVMSKSDDGETAIEENITTYNSFQNEARNKVEEKN